MTWLGVDTPDVPHRDLTCTRCGDLVEVVELPYPYLDPDTYVCSQCGRPVKESP